MLPYKTRRYCGVPGCKNNSTLKPNLRFFRCPRKPERLAEWFSRIQRNESTVSGLYVCGEHFHSDMIDNTYGINHLRTDAVPLLNLPKLKKNPTDNDDTVTSQAVQTDPALTTDECLQTDFKVNPDFVFISRRKKQLLQKLKRKLKHFKPNLILDQNYYHEMYKYEQLIKKHLSENLGKFVLFQQNLRKLPRNQCTGEYKRFLLHLYYTSATGYALMQQLLSLPTQKQLKHMITPQSMTIIESLMQILKCKVDLMTDEQKQCTVCINVIKLKPNLYYNIGQDHVYGFHEIDGVVRPEPANVALVVMARGLYKEWEQLISMVALANSADIQKVQAWVTKLLSNLLNIGLTVRALVTDIDTAYKYIFTERFNSLPSYILINERKIYIIFDVPHLMNMTRNSLMVNSFYFDGQTANWNDIILCYEHDSKKGLLSLLPKITKEHIAPNDYHKEDIKFALQVMSLSYSAAIANYINLNILNDLARGTSQFLFNMNNLFDMLNSDSKTTNNKYKQPYTENCFQSAFLTEMMSFFGDIVVINNNGNDQDATFIEGFQTTICSILQLFTEIQLQFGHLYTRRLNADNLTKYLKKIVDHESEYPTFRQLTKHFKEKFASDILKSPVESKTSDNIEDIMIQTFNIMNLKVFEEDMNTVNKYSNIKIESKMYQKLKIPDERTLLFLVTFLFEQCCNHHSPLHCTELKKHLSNFQVYGETFKTPANFINFVNKMEELFRQYFLINQLPINILDGLLKELDKVPYIETPCPHFPVLFAKKLYARLRISMMLKSNNNTLKLMS